MSPKKGLIKPSTININSPVYYSASFVQKIVKKTLGNRGFLFRKLISDHHSLNLRIFLQTMTFYVITLL